LFLRKSLASKIGKRLPYFARYAQKISALIRHNQVKTFLKNECIVVEERVLFPKEPSLILSRNTVRSLIYLRLQVGGSLLQEPFPFFAWLLRHIIEDVPFRA